MNDGETDPRGLPFPRARRTGGARTGRIAVLVVVITCGIGSALLFASGPPGRDAPPTGEDVTVATSSPPLEASTSRIAALGRIEPLGGVVGLSAPAETVDTRIVALPVAAGDRVGEGDLVAVLGGREKAEANLARALAERRLRRAELERTRRLLEANRTEARAGLAVAQARLAQAESALARATALEGSAAVSAVRVEELRSDTIALGAEVARAEAQLSRYGGPADVHPDVTAAEEALAAADAAARLAAAEVEETLVRAPFAGTIIAVPGRLGARAGEGGIARLAADGPMAVVLEVHQSRIGAVSVADPVVLRSEAFAGELTGRVSEIAAEVRRQEEIGSDPASRTDARVFEVRVLLDERSSEVARRLINVQVVAEIEAGAGA